MAYMNPRMVISPKGSISDLRVLYDGGEYAAGDPWSGWSAAEFEWDGSPAVGVRWNGSDAEGNSHIGNPQSRGIATWFVLPQPLEECVRAQLKYQVVFHPMSAGVSAGNRGPLAEDHTWHPTFESAQAGADKPPRSGYIAVKILDADGKIVWERTAGHHIAQADLNPTVSSATR